jgi:hypothetical protein
MAKPNYAFAKRQRDLSKKQKKEEKRLRKLASQQTPGSEAPGEQDGGTGATGADPGGKGPDTQGS